MTDQEYTRKLERNLMTLYMPLNHIYQIFISLMVFLLGMLFNSSWLFAVGIVFIGIEIGSAIYFLDKLTKWKKLDKDLND